MKKEQKVETEGTGREHLKEAEVKHLNTKHHFFQRQEAEGRWGNQVPDIPHALLQ